MNLKELEKGLNEIIALALPNLKDFKHPTSTFFGTNPLYAGKILSFGEPAFGVLVELHSEIKLVLSGAGDSPGTDEYEAVRTALLEAFANWKRNDE